MAIIIRNLGGDMLGVCEYELRINDQRITTFKHSRLAGLRACLLAAASAVEAQQWQDAFTLETRGTAAIPNNQVIVNGHRVR